MLACYSLWFGCFSVSPNANRMKATHIGGLLIVINVVDISRQAEVCYFHHVVLGYQNIASGEVPVDALQK